MRVFILLCLVLLGSVQMAKAETLIDENSAKDLVKKVMVKVESADLLSAFAIIKPYMPITSAEFDKIVLQYKSVIEQYLLKYGNPTETELIDIKKVGNSLLRIRYIEKNDKYAHTWSFYFQKIKDGWVINSFNWEDSIRNLFL